MRKKESRNILRTLADAQKKTDPRCPYMGTCGGCLMQDIDYDAQLTVKREYVQQLFDDTHIEIKIPQPEPSPEIFYYRNRMDFPIGENGEIGLKPMGSWRDILDLSVCYLQSPQSTEILRIVREWMKDWKIPGWNAVKHRGYMRYVVIREGKYTNERMVMIVTHTDESIHTPSTRNIDETIPKVETMASREKIWSDLVDRMSPLTTTMYHAINPRITDVSHGDELRLLHGEPLMRERTNGMTFFISPFSFFQTNTRAAEILQNYVVDGIAKDDAQPSRILDLYCGSGFFTLPLARRGIAVTGVELDPASIEMAEKNANENNITGATFHAIDAKLHAQELQPGQYNTVIVDPPRAGLHPKVIEKLISIEPKTIIYVSCNPARLVHELPKFLEKYTLSSIKTFDMFPHTPHVETVVKLERI